MAAKRGPQRSLDSIATHLLPFQRTIVSSLIPDPDAHHSEGNKLLILARGLGLTSIISTVLRIYGTPEQLVLLINATPEEEKSMSEEVGVKLKVVNADTPNEVRVEMYKGGGLFSVTSRILVVDMLRKVIPVDLVSGILVLHAESVTPTSLETFVVRVYRQTNKIGFLKAFSDVPEAFTYGLAPLQTVLTQLKIREVMIWPRFHDSVTQDLAKRKADVVELYQPLSDSMRQVQAAIIDCMEVTLSSIKSSNTKLELEDLTIEDALFRSFDGIVRAKLDPVWDKIRPETKKLVGDLTVLRKLQNFLLEFDCVAFNQFLETTVSGQKNWMESQDEKSEWLGTPAGETILSLSKARVFTKGTIEEARNDEEGENEEDGPSREEEEEMRAIQDVEEAIRREQAGLPPLVRKDKPMSRGSKDSNKGWLPPGTQPVLEEQPKWSLLADVLAEIEDELHFSPDPYGISNDTIIVMCSTADTCSNLREYLSTMTEEDGGYDMMRTKLSTFFAWRARLGAMHENLRRDKTYWTHKKKRRGGGATGGESAALKRKTDYTRGRAPMGKRRRTRGGGAAGEGGDRDKAKAAKSTADDLETEAGNAADLLEAQTEQNGAPSYMLPDQPADRDHFSELDFEQFFGLLSNEELVIIRPYLGDEDDRMLEELRPKYIVMYDPDPAFVRRVETYRAAHAGLAVRVYFLLYKDSVEEQRYLSSIRKEKDAFEKLIREKGVMAIPHEAEYRAGEENERVASIRTTSSRAAGGGKQGAEGPSRVIVDIREFRSALPSVLHAQGFQVVPIQIWVGDYIITPEMCVERKSLPDLIQSFTSGRLYQQCEEMTTHYKQPILLIEFDEKRAFNIDTYSDGYGGKGKSNSSSAAAWADTDLRSKLVLLTLSFPRLRIIWSSSPYETVEIFRDLKENRDEPDAEKASNVGKDEDAGGTAAEGTGEGGGNHAVQEMLRALPGIKTNNYRYVMNKVQDLESLCEMDLKGMQGLIGVETGTAMYDFVNRDIRVKEKEKPEERET